MYLQIARILFVCVLYIVLEFKLAVADIVNSHSIKPNAVATFDDNNYISKQIHSGHITNVASYIASTYTSLGQTLIGTCDAEAEKKHADEVEDKRQSQVIAGNKSKNSGRGKRRGRQKKGNSKKSDKGRKNKSSNHNGNDNNNDDDDNDAEAKWYQTLITSKANNAYVCASVCDFSNKQLQTLYDLPRQRMKYVIYYALGGTGKIITNKNIKEKWEYLYNHKIYGVFVKALFDRALAETEVQPRDEITDGNIKQVIKYLISLDVGANNSVIFEGLTLDQIKYLIHDPLKNLPDDNSNSTTCKAISQIWSLWEKLDDHLYIYLKKSFFISNAFFSKLASILTPDLWDKLLHETNCNVENLIQQMVAIIVEPKCIRNYKSEYNKHPDKFDVAANEVEALYHQLIKFLKTQCKTDKAQSKKKWIEKSHNIILFGYYVPFICLQHVEYLQGESNGTPIPRLAYYNNVTFWNHCHSFMSIFLKWLRACSDRKYAGQQLQPSRQSTVFPSNFALAMQELKQTSGTFGDISKIMLRFPHLIYCIYFDLKINSTGNGLGRGFRDMVQTEMNWLKDAFWKHMPILTVPSNRKRVFGLIVPTIHVAPMYFGQTSAIYTNGKFPRYVYGPNWLVLVMISGWNWGYGPSITDEEGPQLNLDDFDLYRNFMTEQGMRVTTCVTKPGLFAMIYLNGRIMQNKPILLLDIGEPIPRKSAAHKHLNTKMTKYDRGMFCNNI